MKNLSVKNKLIVSFSIIFVLVILILGTVFVSISVIDKNVTKFHDNAFKGVQLADKIDILITQSTREALYAANDPNSNRSKTKASNSKSALKNLINAIEELRPIYSGDQTILDNMKSDAESLISVIESENAVITGTDTAASFSLYEEKILPIQQSITSLSLQLAEYENTVADDIYASTCNQTKLTIIMVTVISVAAVCIGVFFAFYITKLMCSGIKNINNVALDMANGNFNIDITYKSKDEIGEAGRAMQQLANNTNAVIADLGVVLDDVAAGNLAAESQNKHLYVGIFSNILTSTKSFTDKLNKTMLRIDNVTEQIATGSEEVSSDAQTIAQGSTEQAASVEELSSTMAAISDMIKANTNDADTANSKAGIAGTQISKANEKMAVLINAMNDIKASSAKIEKIIMTIDDIAFQTNILALNAAVEAARAGAAGKGFAVVADEVRNLAGKSSEAAQNTNVLINSTLEAIEHGNTIVSEMADDMNIVSNSASSVAEINAKIAKESKDAEESINQIMEGINQIAGVVQVNAATAEQSAAASVQLSNQAQTLKELLDEFVFIQGNDEAFKNEAENEYSEFTDNSDFISDSIFEL